LARDISRWHKIPSGADYWAGSGVLVSGSDKILFWYFLLAFGGCNDYFPSLSDITFEFMIEKEIDFITELGPRFKADLRFISFSTDSLGLQLKFQNMILLACYLNIRKNTKFFGCDGNKVLIVETLGGERLMDTNAAVNSVRITLIHAGQIER